MKTFLCLLSAIVFAGCATHSSDGAPQAKVAYPEFSHTMLTDGFGKTDTNGDGSITWDEWQQLDASPDARMHFDALDADHNGKITINEWKTGLKKGGVSMSLFKQLDTNQDGYLSPSELNHRPVGSLFRLKF